MSRVPPFQPTSSNIATTPNFSVVPTSTGMAQGDMVFWKSGDYQTFSSQVSTATFPLAFDAPIMSGVTGGIGGTINSNMTTTAPSGGNSGGRNVATLSNGNIVVASASTSGIGYFTIYDTTFATVVSRVNLPGTQTASSNTVGVAALTGGGFVIYFTNGSGQFCYAVYTNTGTVTTALSSNTTASVGNTANPFAVVGLSGGGFVAVGGGTTMFYMIFNATGGQTFSNASAGSGTTAATVPIVVANNNNTFFMMWNQSSSAYAWSHISSTNSTLGSGTIACTSVGQASSCTATVLGNGTTIVVAYAANSSESVGIRQYNSTTYSMGAQTAYSTPSTGQSVLSVYAKTLSSGNVFLCIAQPFVTFYTMFNSSMTPILASGTTTAAPAFRSLSPKYSNQGSIQPYISSCMFGMEIGTSLYLFYSTQRAFGDGNQMYEAIDLTAYNPVSPLTASISAGTVTAAVGAYVTSSLTPISVSYYPAATTGYSVGTASISGGAANLVNGSFNPQSFDVCTLTNGNFVIVYRNDNSPYEVSAKVYGPTGSVITTVTIAASSTSTGMYNSVKVAALASGKFVVSYYDSSNSAICAIVSASYAVTSTVAISNVDYASSTTTNKCALGSMSNDRFVFAWNTSSGYYYANVYDSNGSLLHAVTTTTGDLVNDVGGMPGGGYVILCNNNMYYYQETAANTFTLLGSTSVSFNNPLSRMNITSKGQVVVYLPYTQWGGGVAMVVNRYSLVNRAGSALLADISSSNTPSSQTPYIGAELQNGTFALVSTTASNSSVTARGTGATIGATVVAGGTNMALIRPLQNDSFVMVCRSAPNSYLTYAVVYTGYNLTSLITAGVTQSSSVSLLSSTYRFAGVAANTVAANGVGVVQTNGAAKLNSNYSTAVAGQTFSARDNTSPGVNGTINGRNMVLYGIGITGTT